MITALKGHWITGLTVLAVAFLIFISIAGLAASDPEYATEDRFTGVVAGLSAVALVAGLWGLHTGRVKVWVAHALIVPGAIVTLGFFWLFLVPAIVGLVILFAGVLRGGLQRELDPHAAAA